MTEKDRNLEIAVFRFGLIAEFVTGVHLEYGEHERLLKEKTSRSYKIPHSSSTHVSRSTIKKWITDYKESGNKLESLMPSSRKDRGSFKSLDSSLQSAMIEIIEDKGKLTSPALIKELYERRHLRADEKINSSVLYRFLKKHKLQKKKAKVDRRAFEASSPNELWQSDVLHGPSVVGKGGRKAKSYLIAILDDNSRLIPHGEFYLSEGLENFKNCLKQAVEKRGLPQKLYIDNGACYKAINLEQVTALLGIQIIHTPPYTPQGRGKIERWFRYVRDNFLSTEKLSLEALNERFSDWLEGYHHRVHGATQQKPIDRYHENMKCIRPAPPDLLDYFRLIEFRRVQKDRTIRLSGTIFEVPASLIDRRVELRFHKEAPQDVEVFFENRSYGKAILLDKHVNFRVGRNNKITSDPVKTQPNPGELF